MKKYPKGAKTMQLSTAKQIRQALLINQKHYEQLMNEGMPHLLIGEKVRFHKTEVVQWVQTYMLKQERLEKAFVDDKGRTIEQYVTIGTLKERLQLKKKKIHSLCNEGMPHQNIGDKPFFHLEEVFAYFARSTESNVSKPSPQKPTVIIVDGSHHPKTNEICTGMVIQSQEGIQGFSTLHDVRTGVTQHCEYLALQQALTYVKEKHLSNVVIGTDQIDFIRIIEKGEKKYFSWMKTPPYCTTIDKIYHLIDELKEHVQIVYANDPRYKTLYHNAHALSRRYEHTVEQIATTQPLSVKKRLERVLPSANTLVLPPNSEESKHTLHIRFSHAKKIYAYFYVTFQGTTKLTKLTNSNPTRSALALAYTYAHTAKQKMTVFIEAMPNFRQDMNSIYLSEKINEPKKTTEFIEKLYATTVFRPKDDFATYLQEIKEKTNIA